MSLISQVLSLFAVPPWLTNLTEKIYEQSGLFPSAINHVLINEYLPDQGIMVCAEPQTLLLVIYLSSPFFLYALNYTLQVFVKSFFDDCLTSIFILKILEIF